MNRQEWMAKILSAMAPEGRTAAQSGQSTYDQLLDEAGAIAGAPDAIELIEAVLLIGRKGGSESGEWWLSLLMFLDGQNLLVNPALLSSIIEFVESEAVSDPLARGYVVRYFANAGLPLNWKRLEKQKFYRWLLGEAPLLLADGLLRSNQIDLASDAIKRAKANPDIQLYHIEQMMDRWRGAGLKVPESILHTGLNSEILSSFGPVSYTSFLPKSLAAAVPVK